MAATTISMSSLSPMKSLKSLSTNRCCSPAPMKSLSINQRCIPTLMKSPSTDRRCILVPMKSLSQMRSLASISMKSLTANRRCNPAPIRSAPSLQLASVTEPAMVLLTSPIWRPVLFLVLPLLLGWVVMPWVLSLARSKGSTLDKMVAEAVVDPVRCMATGCVILGYFEIVGGGLLCLKCRERLLWSFTIACGLRCGKALIDGIAQDDKGGKTDQDNYLKVILWSVLVISGMRIWQIPGDRVFNVLGLGGTIIAFISKDLLNNILMGMLVRLRNVFQVGDSIKIQAGKLEGRVLNMGPLSVSLVGEDGAVTYSPYPTELVNKSHSKYWTIKMTVSMTSVELDMMSSIMEDIAEKLKHKGVAAEKPPTYDLVSLEDNRLKVSIQVFLSRMDEKDVPKTKHVVWCQVMQILRSHDSASSIEIN